METDEGKGASTLLWDTSPSPREILVAASSGALPFTSLPPLATRQRENLSILIAFKTDNDASLEIQ